MEHRRHGYAPCGNEFPRVPFRGLRVQVIENRQRRTLLRIQPAALGHVKYITVMEGLL